MLVLSFFFLFVVCISAPVMPNTSLSAIINIGAVSLGFMQRL